jgi:ABC-2 type transport system ATP-binding protein
MRRRLDVAAALVARPPVLFLDEPTTGLDPQSRIDLWAVIEGLVEHGTTVLLTTQYLEEADRLAGQIAVVDHGQVISEGSPAELKANLGATVLEVGLGSEILANQAAEPLSRLSGHGAHVIGSVLEVTIDGGAQTVMEALRVLDQLQLQPVTFSVREPSLDDVFLSLTGRQARTESEKAESDAPSGPSRRERGRRR